MGIPGNINEFGTRAFVADSFRSLRVFDIVYSANTEQLAFAPIFIKNRTYSAGWQHATCGRWVANGPAIYRATGIAQKDLMRFGEAKFHGGKPYITVTYQQRIPRKRDLAIMPFNPVDYSAGMLYDVIRQNVHLPAHVALLPVDHTIPSRDCMCGFYSFYGLVQAMESDGTFSRASAPVLAVVENAGRVLHGTLGLRSERLRIVGWTWAIPVVAPDLPWPRDLEVVQIRHTEIGRIGIGAAEWNIGRYTLGEAIACLTKVAPFYTTVEDLMNAHPLSLPPE